MGQVLHGSATTTEAVRRAIQHSQACLRTLAKRHGINPKTVAKGRKRQLAIDLPTGLKDPSSPHCRSPKRRWWWRSGARVAAVGCKLGKLIPSYSSTFSGVDAICRP